VAAACALVEWINEITFDPPRWIAMFPFCSTVRTIFFPDGLQTVNKFGLYQFNEIESLSNFFAALF